MRRRRSARSASGIATLKGRIVVVWAAGVDADMRLPSFSSLDWDFAPPSRPNCAVAMVRPAMPKKRRREKGISPGKRFISAVPPFLEVTIVASPSTGARSSGQEDSAHDQILVAHAAIIPAAA